MTDFAEFISKNRERLRGRAADIRQELSEIETELAAIDAYDATKRQRMGLSPSPHKTGTGRYPHQNDGTLSVPEAGREFLGLSESRSWVAVQRGDIPAIKIGRYRRVPIDAMRRKLEERRAAE